MNVTLFGDRIFADLIKLRWALIQYNRYPYKKKNQRHRGRSVMQTHTGRRQPCNHGGRCTYKPSNAWGCQKLEEIGSIFS